MEALEAGGDVLYTKTEEELSPINYKTQALLTFFFSALCVNDFYAGNYLTGGVKLVASVFLTKATCGILPVVIHFYSINKLRSGEYRDGNGKLIRNPVQISKEKASPKSSSTAYYLTLLSCVGFAGIHQFYAGKPLKGLAMLLTEGGLGFWQLWNVYNLMMGTLTDGEGKVICPPYMVKN